MEVQVVRNLGTSKAVEYCFLAEIPNWDHKDVKAMFHETMMKPNTPKQLFDMIPDRLPAASEFLRAAKHEECFAAIDRNVTGAGHHEDKPCEYGVYKITQKEVLEQAQQWKWDQVFAYLNRVQDQSTGSSG